MSNLERMCGVVLNGHGGPEMLQWRTDLKIPPAGHDDVVVRVNAAGVNNTDINTRTAWYSKGGANADDATWSGKPLTFPRIQGADVCGEIVAAGRSVNAARIGERILIEPCIRHADGEDLSTPWYFGSECDGGFAQYTRVASRHAHTVDSDLTDVELASFPCSYSTAENMLTRARGWRRDHTGHRSIRRRRLGDRSTGTGARRQGRRRHQRLKGRGPDGAWRDQDT